MALINTAAILAGRGFRVLVIDFDLEAPGLSYLTRKTSPHQGEQNTDNSPMPQGLIDLLADAKERGLEADLFARPIEEVAQIYTHAYPLDNAEAGGTLSIMPAGKLDQGYTKRFDDLNLRELYGEGVGEPLMRIFKEKFAESDLYDYVLIDSRTGFSDEAGICTQDLADFMMILSGLNKQNIEGTGEFLQALRFASGGKAKFQIILSPVPSWQEDLLAEREKVAQEFFNNAWGSEVDLSLQIPYHPRLALTEEPQVFANKSSALLTAYREIEEQMLDGLGHNARKLQHEFHSEFDAKEYQSAMLTLQRLVRLDEGHESLEDIAMRLSQEATPRSGTKIAGQKQKEVALTELFKNKNGRKLITFLIDNIKYENLIEDMFYFSILLHENDSELAKKFYQRLIPVSPSEPILLGNYGQLLIGFGNFSEGTQLLRSAISLLTPSKDFIQLCEFCFSLWLAEKLQAQDPTRWLQNFKYYLQQDWKRLPWNFDDMLAQAEKILSPDEFTFAKALADAFLDETKVPLLEEFAQWQAIEPQPIA